MLDEHRAENFDAIIRLVVSPKKTRHTPFVKRSKPMKDKMHKNNNGEKTRNNEKLERNSPKLTAAYV